MTNRFGIDEAWARLTPAQLAAAGKTFVVGYISEDTGGKNLTAAEVAECHAAGIAVLLVYEYSTRAIEGGAAKGHHDAAIAIAHARALGYPTGCAIGWAVDENTTGRAQAVDAYATAMTGDLHAAGYRSMDYGGLATVQRCADLHLADLHWQTYAWSGSPTRWDNRAAIRQVQNGVVINGKNIDLDVAVVDDFGAWLPGTTNGVAIMSGPLTPAEDNELANAYAALLIGGPSCGQPVPNPANTGPTYKGNSLIDLAQHNRAILDRLAAGQPVTLSTEDRNAIVADITATMLAGLKAAVRAELAAAARAEADALSQPET
jgi:hypothetical protein